MWRGGCGDVVGAGGRVAGVVVAVMFGGCAGGTGSQAGDDWTRRTRFLLAVVTGLWRARGGSGWGVSLVDFMMRGMLCFM